MLLDWRDNYLLVQTDVLTDVWHAGWGTVSALRLGLINVALVPLTLCPCFVWYAGMLLTTRLVQITVSALILLDTHTPTHAHTWGTGGHNRICAVYNNIVAWPALSVYSCPGSMWRKISVMEVKHSAHSAITMAVPHSTAKSYCHFIAFLRSYNTLFEIKVLIIESDLLLRAVI